jgi:hypothetical protein
LTLGVPAVSHFRRESKKFISNAKRYQMSPLQIASCSKTIHRYKEARVAFCTDMIGLLRENPDIMNNLLMTDEAHFHLSGVVNKQNMRYWSSVKPKELHEMPLHSPKVTVWCGVGVFGIVGPYFFETDNEAAVAGTSERYVTMLEDFVAPHL